MPAVWSLMLQSLLERGGQTTDLMSSDIAAEYNRLCEAVQACTASKCLLHYGAITSLVRSVM